jgi:hypothetical protein
MLIDDPHQPLFIPQHVMQFVGKDGFELLQSFETESTLYSSISCASMNKKVLRQSLETIAQSDSSSNIYLSAHCRLEC